MEEIDAGKLPPEAIEHIRCQAFVLREHGHMTMWPNLFWKPLYYRPALDSGCCCTRSSQCCTL